MQAAPATQVSNRRFVNVGFTAVAGNQIMERMFGIDASNIWSLRGIIPRSPGPNFMLALMISMALGGDWAAKAKLKQEYGTPAGSPGLPGVGRLPLEGTWVPRGLRKATGMSHRSLEPGSPYRYLPVRPVEEEGRGRRGRRSRKKRRTRR